MERGLGAKVLLHNPKLCAACDAPDSRFRCSCQQVQYCGPECQHQDWPAHKKVCVLRLSEQVKEKKRELGRDDIEVATAQIKLGDAHRQRGRFKNAEKCYLEAHRIVTAIDSNCKEASVACSRLGSVYNGMGRYGDSLAKLEEALRIVRLVDGENSAATALALFELGNSLDVQGRRQEALSRYEESLRMSIEIHGNNSPEIASTLECIGGIHHQAGNIERALETRVEAQRILRMQGAGEDLALNTQQHRAFVPRAGRPRKGPRQPRGGVTDIPQVVLLDKPP